MVCAITRAMPPLAPRVYGQAAADAALPMPQSDVYAAAAPDDAADAIALMLPMLFHAARYAAAASRALIRFVTFSIFFDVACHTPACHAVFFFFFQDDIAARLLRCYGRACCC